MHTSLSHFQSSMLPILSSYFSNITHASIIQSTYLLLLSFFMCIIKLIYFAISPPAHSPRSRSKARSKLRLRKKSIIAFRNSVHNNMLHCHRVSAFILQQFDRVIIKYLLQQNQQKYINHTFVQKTSSSIITRFKLHRSIKTT